MNDSAKPRRTLLAGLMLALAAGLALAQDQQAIEVTNELSTPESALYDPQSDTYLVSNINGSPLEADDNGYISRISPEGEVVEARWIDGQAEGVDLDAPKGLAISGDTLFVSDITNVRMFDLATGEQTGSVAVEGALFLNDLAPHPEGGVVATDTAIGPDFQPAGPGAVYRVTAEGQVETLASGEELGQPNGIAALPGGGFVVVTFGNQVYELHDGELQNERQLDATQLDGVVALENGDLLVSSWGQSAVLRVAQDGTVTPLLEGVEAPADIGFDEQRDRVLVPLFNANALRIAPLQSGQ